MKWVDVVLCGLSCKNIKMTGGFVVSGERRYDNNYYYKLTICYPCIVWLLLSQITGNTLPYDELHHIQARLEELAPHLVRYGDMEPANFFGLAHKLIKVIYFIVF